MNGLFFLLPFLLIIFLSFIVYSLIHNFILRRLLKPASLSIRNQMLWITIPIAIILSIILYKELPSDSIILNFVLFPIQLDKIFLQNFIEIPVFEYITAYITFICIYSWIQLIFIIIQIQRKFHLPYIKTFLYALIAQWIALFSSFLVIVGLVRVIVGSTSTMIDYYKPYLSQINYDKPYRNKY